MAVNNKFFQWLDKLKSGEIQQGSGTLHKIRVNEGEETAYMCCLGVCSSMFAEEMGISVRREGNGISYNSKAHYPDTDVLLHMGIPESHIVERSIGWSILVSTPANVRDRLGDDYWYTNLISVDILNDNGWSFEEIADLLRKEFASETLKETANA